MELPIIRDSRLAKGVQWKQVSGSLPSGLPGVNLENGYTGFWVTEPGIYVSTLDERTDEEIRASFK